MSKTNSPVLLSARRTPVGSFLGQLSSVPAPELGAAAIRAALDSAGISPEQVDEAIMGNVLPAGLGQAPARQAALKAGLPLSVECLTINKMCGSGLKAVMLAAQAIQTGDAECIVAGGMENMSRAPYLLPKGRQGYRMGHGQIIDSMILDGLWDVYTDQHMGNCAELCAADRHYSREEQDTFARRSYEKAQAAQQEGRFEAEIVAVSVPQRKGDPLLVSQDEEPGRARFDKMPRLRPAFQPEGTITAANASKINDGAAAVVVMDASRAKEGGFRPLARIVAQASAAQEPEWFTTAPVKAIEKVLTKAGMQVGDIDLWEINEAFAPVTMAAIDTFQLDEDRVNVHGGAIALGHPIGASGARILVTLLHAMEQRQAGVGLATLCIGGGEASALIVEKM
ncbi:MAG: acetyl-CoA C-acetyltransferase [Candidatus Neomarinimicrobiota bacterium]|nr:MAG: acetyl-CoA C-acetyltransferase [Candidatus Neomarinimicrobiota bacterium]